MRKIDMLTKVQITIGADNYFSKKPQLLNLLKLIDRAHLSSKDQYELLFSARIIASQLNLSV